MRLIRRLLPVALAIPLALGACGDDDPEPRRSITVSGDVSNRTDAAVPDDAQLVVAWAIDDSSYVHGGGTISADGGSFVIELDAPPPPEAMIADFIAIGLIVAVAGDPPAPGEPIDPDLEGVIGLAGDYAIIYVADRPAASQGPWWLPRVPDGYSLGRGIEREDELFEGFEDVDPGSAELIIDDPSNIDVVNWT